MWLLGIVLLGVAFLAANWRKEQHYLQPRKRTTTVKPGAILILAGLGLLFLFASCATIGSSDGRVIPVNSIAPTKLDGPGWYQGASGLWYHENYLRDPNQSHEDFIKRHGKPDKQ